MSQTFINSDEVTLANTHILSSMSIIFIIYLDFNVLQGKSRLCYQVFNLQSQVLTLDRFELVKIQSYKGEDLGVQNSTFYRLKFTYENEELQNNVKILSSNLYHSQVTVNNWNSSHYIKSSLNRDVKKVI